MLRRSFTSVAKDYQKVFVVGVGMTNFEKPGKRKDDYPVIAAEAGNKALKDAGLSYEAIEQAVVGFVYGESTSGNRVCYEMGMTGIPITNVNNNCSTGSTALYNARQLIAGGQSNCVLALGFEKMQPGSIQWGGTDRESPMQRFFDTIKNISDVEYTNKIPLNPYMFAEVAKEHMKKYGSTPKHFAMIGEKNHRHSQNNPYSQFRDVYTLDEVLNSPMICDPLTRLQCSPTSDGAAAAIVVSEGFVREHGLQHIAIELAACEMSTDTKDAFANSPADCVGKSMSKMTANKAYAKVGLTPNDIDVIELHDCFSANELVTYEALGLADEGKAHHLIDAGDNTYGGKWLINPSGGLISKGHPLGATGLAQCAESVWQLRGTADKRQLDGAQIAMAHNLGMGGACVVSIFKNDFIF